MFIFKKSKSSRRSVVKAVAMPQSVEPVEIRKRTQAPAPVVNKPVAAPVVEELVVEAQEAVLEVPVADITVETSVEEKAVPKTTKKKEKKNDTELK